MNINVLSINWKCGIILGDHSWITECKKNYYLLLKLHESYRRLDLAPLEFTELARTFSLASQNLKALQIQDDMSLTLFFQAPVCKRLLQIIEEMEDR